VDHPSASGHPLVGDHYLQKSLLFRNLGNGHFRDITEQAGEGFATPRPARGLAIGDLDGDGRPEIVIVNMNQTPSLLKNLSPQGNWLRVTLAGTRSNRSALGARVTIRYGGAAQMNELVGGGSYLSQNEAALYFGLGSATSLDSIEVRWPNGGVQKLSKTEGNRTVHIIEN